ncbi:MAG: hypothetical protein NC092_13305 [Butyrivibrio sp.]|nr:hypothetical protein [Muribaculum sp.]MCM1553649.1 hypothetical protein [Butyrivibrio sp.]
METIFGEVVNRSLSVGVLIMGIILLRPLLKRAPKGIRFVLWLFVAVRLICPLPLESSFSLMPDVENIMGRDLIGERSDFVGKGDLEDLEETNPAEQEGRYAESEGKAVPTGALGSPVGQEGQSGASWSPTGLDERLSDSGNLVGWEGRLTDSWNLAGLEGQSADSGLSPDDVSAIRLAQVLPWVWISGMVIMALYGGVSYLGLKRSLRTAVRLEGNLWQSERVVSPFIMGIVRPRIYLPFSIQESELTYVLAHERSHIRHGDHVIKPFAFALLAVYWFQPLVWVAFILLCRDMELACDERVVQSLGAKERKEYAESLLALSVRGNVISACPVAFGEVEVKGRIREILNYKKPGFWVGLLAVAVCLTVGVCFLTEPRKDSSEGQAVAPNPSEELLAGNPEKDSEEISAGEAAVREASAEVTSKEELSAKEASAEKASLEEKSLEKSDMEEGASGEASIGEMSAENEGVDPADVPEEVWRKAEELAQEELSWAQENWPEAGYDECRVDFVEFYCEVEQLLGIDLVFYEYSCSQHVKNPENVFLEVGMDFLDLNKDWLKFYGSDSSGKMLYQRTPEGLKYLCNAHLAETWPEDEYFASHVLERLVGYPYPEDIIEDVPEVENLDELLGDWDAWIYDQEQVVERAFDYYNEQNLGDGLYAYKSEEGYQFEYMGLYGAGPHQACVQSTEEGYVIVMHMDRQKGYWRITGYHIAKIG